ncbi:hypothetical protein [Butyrivibrio sp. AE3004]|uniref:hypothetical protein n=1 Tax=Butyrivibrio sp. AE3004 TaxID=1506994 RepID=UPI000689D856|nr:hypothetical protein [Butyrivibrio sp. AE3004]
MYKKNLLKATSVLTAFALASSAMTGCGLGKNTETSKASDQVQDIKEENPEAEELVDTMTKTAFTGNKKNADSGKEETVYVMTDADGKVDEVVVSNWLKNASGDKELTDKTNLKDIVNVKGEESFKDNGDGTVTWDAEGSDIYYQGTPTEEVPVGVKVTYELDGKQMKADEIAGKSGSVKIRFDYTNSLKKEVEIDGEKENIDVPFTMISGTMLDSDKFANVKVSNGKVISDANNYVVVGVAMPGLKESLKIDDEKLEEKDISKDDVDIPNYVEITADVQDFELPMTVSMASANVVADLGLDKIYNSDKITDLNDDMDKLSDASTELRDGSGELADGTQKFEDGTVELYDGTVELKDGTKSLKDGTGQLVSGAAELKDGTGELKNGTGELRNGAGELKNGTSELKKGTGDLKKGTGDLKKGTGDLKKGTGDLKKGTGDLKKGTGDLKKGAGDLATGTNDLKKGATELDKGIVSYTDGVGQIYTGAKSLDDGAGKLVTGATTLTGGITSAKTGAEQLSTGAAQLSAGIDKAADSVRDNLAGVDAALTAFANQFGPIMAEYNQITAGANLNTLNVSANSADDVQNLINELTGKIADAYADDIAKETKRADEAEAKAEAETKRADDATKRAEDAENALKEAGNGQKSNQQNSESTSENVNTDENAEPKSEGNKESNAPAENNGEAGAETNNVNTDEGNTNSEATVNNENSANETSQTEENVPEENNESTSNDQIDVNTQEEQTSNDEAMQSAPEENTQNNDCATEIYDENAEEVVSLDVVSGTTEYSAESDFATISAVTGLNVQDLMKMQAVGQQTVEAMKVSGAEQAASFTAGWGSEVSNLMKQGDLQTTAQMKVYYYGQALALIAENVKTPTQTSTEGMTKIFATYQSLQTSKKSLEMLYNGTGEGGLKDIQAGAAQLAVGANDLKEGMKKLDQGGTTFSTGLSALKEGAGKLALGAETLNSNSTALKNGSKQLADGAGKLADGTKQLKDGAEKLDDGAGKLNDGVGKLDDGAGKLHDGVGKLDDGVGKLDDGAGKLDDGVGKLADGTVKLDDGVGQVADGVGKLYDGTVELDDGAGKLDDGAGKLKDGVSKLKDGAVELNDGARKLADGMVEFDEDGIQKLTSTVDEDIVSIKDRLKAVDEASQSYTSFSGANENEPSTVQFIIRTAPVKAD